MAAKLTRLTHKLTIQLHLAAESCTICSSRTRRPVRKLLDITSHMCKARFELFTAMDIQIMVFWVGCDVMW
jgi:hypothetical protein